MFILLSLKFNFRYYMSNVLNFWKDYIIEKM